MKSGRWCEAMEKTKQKRQTEKAGRESQKPQKPQKPQKRIEGKEGREERLNIPPADEILVGRNAVFEALKAGRGINRILVAQGGKEAALAPLLALAREQGVPVRASTRQKLDLLAPDMRHQGVLAYAAPVAYASLDDVFARAEEKGEPPLLLLLDEIEDPHNFGALLRTADAMGVHGVLVPERRSCALTATVAKTSAGAVEHVPVVRIGNIVQEMKRLKERGLWFVGADMAGEHDIFCAALTGALVIVIGSEGKGLGRLVKETCDFLVRIPMHGAINSLNASVAGALLMYEARRARLLGKA